jgi:hypothetical protein
MAFLRVLFMVNLMTLPVAQIIWRMATNLIEEIWKETAVV